MEYEYENFYAKMCRILYNHQYNKQISAYLIFQVEPKNSSRDVQVHVPQNVHPSSHSDSKKIS